MRKDNGPIFISLLIVSLFFTVVFYYGYTNMTSNKSQLRATNFYDAKLSTNLSSEDIDRLNKLEEVELAGGASSEAQSAKWGRHLISFVGQDADINKMREYSYLIAGRFPKTKQEIVLNESLVKKEQLKPGDMVELDLGNRLVDGEKIDARSTYTDRERFETIKRQKFKLVGVYKDFYNENLKINYGIYFIDQGENLIPFIRFTSFKEAYTDRNKLQKKISHFLNKNVEVDFNKALVRYYGLASSPAQAIMAKLVNVFSVLLCFAIFIFFIKNIFWIWSLKKIHELSMYKSIGSTDLQIYKILLKGAISISVVPILLGHGFGFFLTKFLFQKANSGKAETVFFNDVHFNLLLSSGIVLIAMAVVLVAVIFPAKKVAKIDIIDGLRGNLNFGRRTKKRRNPNIWKELRLNNSPSIKSQRYISSVGIIIISIFLIVITMSVYTLEYTDFDDGYDITVNYYNKTGNMPVILQDILKEFNGKGFISKEKYVTIGSNLSLSEAAKANHLDEKLAKAMEDSSRNYLNGRIIALEKQDLQKIGGKSGEYVLYNQVQKNLHQPISEAKRIQYFKNPRELQIGIREDDDNNSNTIGINVHRTIDQLGAYQYRIMPFDVLIFTDFQTYNHLMQDNGDQQYLDNPFVLKLKVETDKTDETKKYIKSKIENIISYDESFNIFTKEELRKTRFTDVESFKVLAYGIAGLIFLLNITNGYSAINISLMSRQKEIGTLYSVGMDLATLKTRFRKEFLIEQGKSFIISAGVSLLLMAVITLLSTSIDLKGLLLYFPYLTFISFSLLVYGWNVLIHHFALKSILSHETVDLIKNVSMAAGKE